MHLSLVSLFSRVLKNAQTCYFLGPKLNSGYNLQKILNGILQHLDYEGFILLGSISMRLLNDECRLNQSDLEDCICLI